MTDTTPDYAGLIERLHELAKSCGYEYGTETGITAFDAVTALRTLLERNKELEARLAEADRVIEPFAEYLDDGFDLDYEGRPLPDSNTLGWVYLTLGHLRDARSYRDKGRE